MPTSVADVDWVRRAFGNISDLSYKGMKDMLLFQEDLANIELKEILPKRGIRLSDGITRSHFPLNSPLLVPLLPNVLRL